MRRAPVYRNALEAALARIDQLAEENASLRARGPRQATVAAGLCYRDPIVWCLLSVVALALAALGYIMFASA